MTEKADNLIFDINEIFQKKNQKETKIHEKSIQLTPINVINSNLSTISSSENNATNDQKKSKTKACTATAIFCIFFFIEIGFTVFMLYNLYYIFNRPSKDIDLSSNKYNKTLNFLSMSSNLGTINGTTLEMFHDVNISRNTPFVILSQVGTFYPDGRIVNNSFRIEGMYTDNFIFMNTNIIGRGDFKGNIDFNNVSITPLKDFNVVEIIVGNLSFTSDGVKNVANDTFINYTAECNNTLLDLQMLEMENQNNGEVIGQHDRKLAILKDKRIFLRSNGNDDEEIFDLENEKYEEIKFVNFIARRNEVGIILKDQNSEIKILKSNSKLSNFPTNIISATLFQNKSLIYRTNDSDDIKIMPNIDKPDKNYILMKYSNKNKFLVGRLYGGKIIIAVTHNEYNDNPNIFIFKCQNPVDISTYGKMAVITEFKENGKQFHFWLFNNNQTKLIASFHADSVKASFIHMNSIIIAYSNIKGTFYVKYDIFDDQLSSEINIDEFQYDSFYISKELRCIFGNKKNSAFALLENFDN